ncbi:hypothetical protein LDENG_00137870 [Lucifuga dentata]|nr:hypothetical protein LDENG_00137870 [Lucifuga dentata]
MHRTFLCHTHTLFCIGTYSSVVLKMGHLTIAAVIAVLFALFMEAEANAFVYTGTCTSDFLLTCGTYQTMRGYKSEA